MSYLRDGLPEEHRVIVMRPAEAPDPTEGELADIRRALEDPEVDRLRLAVEAAGTAEGRVAALAEFNRALGEELERLADARREDGGDPDP